MRKIILLLTISLYFLIGSKGYAQESPENFLVNTTFTWTDNGKTQGTITFTTDGVAHHTWSDLPSIWKLEANNDLLVLTNDTQYVARLKWNSASQSFSGERDVTSQVQDGVKTVIKEVEESPENFLVNTTFTWTDNGRTIGTITFTTDGVAHHSWSDLHSTWKLEANNDLLILTNGTQYVVRLKWNSASQSFSGERDVTSQIQDGVKTVMEKTRESEDYLNKAIKEKGFVNLYGIRFDSGKDIPISESEETLNELASFLRSNPKIKIEIIGHTDSDGDNKFNEDLSLRRAQSIINWLKSKDVNISNLNASGLGESNPVSNNNTESGKALNRRVEIKLIK